MKFTYFRADHTTTIEEAKRQYHRLCLRWHPDRPDGDLKAMGMRWAPKKHLWCKSPKNWKRKHHGELTMDEIRNRFGSQKVETEKQAALTA